MTEATTPTTTAAHCWHLKSAAVGKKPGTSTNVSVCCWCGGERKQTTHKRTTQPHGLKVLKSNEPPECVERLV